MAARSKSKKTTSTKTKKAEITSGAKSRSKRSAKATAQSSARNRVTKSKASSTTRSTRKADKTAQSKVKNTSAKLSKGQRTSSKMAHGASATRKPVGIASRGAAGSKSKKAARSTSAPKAAATVRARLKEQETKLPIENRNAQMARTAMAKAAETHVGPKSNPDHSGHISNSAELTAPIKSAAHMVKTSKAAAPEEMTSSPPKGLKAGGQRQGFKLNEFVVYPAHGVGQITAIEEQEVAGFKLELFVISFSKDKLTLRVPTSKVSGVGMRKISDPDTAKRSLDILTGRARVKRTMWSRRAQEYETKINSGDINAIAEVVRDLYRSEAQPEQSYSERQLYEAALDRMVREIAAVQKSNEIDALKTVEAQLQKGHGRTTKSLPSPSSATEIEEAA
jgi:CarD family transcriptional regulator